jgi:hypothetical protein
LDDEVAFEWESWRRIMPEALPMLRIYWNSGGVLFAKELPWDPDIPLSIQLEESGRLQIYTARRAGRLIGLNSFNVGNTLFRKNSIAATGIILYLVPCERRGSVGIRLIKGAEERLKQIGVDLVHYLPSSSVDIGRLLRICGYTQQGSSFEKLLKKGTSNVQG